MSVMGPGRLVWLGSGTIPCATCGKPVFRHDNWTARRVPYTEIDIELVCACCANRALERFAATVITNWEASGGRSVFQRAESESR